MKHVNSLIAVALAIVPALAAAQTQVFRCSAPHSVRITGPDVPGVGTPTELRFTLVTFSNADPEHEAVIERLTWRDADGVVRHDSGPKIGVPHPPSTGGRDITTVPPGGSFITSTNALGWGPNHPPFAPQPPAGEGLFLTSGTMTVEVFKRGRPRLFVVEAKETARARIIDPVSGIASLGEERSAVSGNCVRIGDGDD
jgi:hypothetical protein